MGFSQNWTRKCAGKSHSWGHGKASSPEAASAGCYHGAWPGKELFQQGGPRGPWGVVKI